MVSRVPSVRPQSDVRDPESQPVRTRTCNYCSGPPRLRPWWGFFFEALAKDPSDVWVVYPVSTRCQDRPPALPTEGRPCSNLKSNLEPLEEESRPSATGFDRDPCRTFVDKDTVP